MTAELFQSNGKGGGSSSSSAANPFQALAHFYEQELTDVHIDSRLSSVNSTSRNYRQQNQHKQVAGRGLQHLFPSSPSSSLSSSASSPLRSSSTSFAAAQYTHKDLSPYTHQAAQDEYRVFSNHQHHDHHHPSLGDADASDVSQYLNQRQEYYARESQLRSQDQNDGLGPIVDFSELLRSQRQIHKSRFEDHLEVRHHNPYATASGQHSHPHRQYPPQHQDIESSHRPRFDGTRASSQQEQVAMDLGQKAVLHSDEANGREEQQEMAWMKSMDLAWSQSAGSGMRGRPPQDELVERGGSPGSASRNAAASIPSSWPLAPWAIETEAALQEFGAVYKDYGPQQQQQQRFEQRGSDESISRQPADEWSKEFTRVNLSSSPLTSSPHQEDNEAPAKERRGSFKTCGHMWDAKTKDKDDASELAALLSSLPTSTSTSSTSFSSSNTQQWSPAAPEQPQPQKIPAAMTPIPLLEPIERVATGRAEVYNDDVFEGDMLQAWMETLAQEKQEADERTKDVEEKKKKQDQKDEVLDEAEQKVVLEVAVRRLNALMHQLDRRQGAGGIGKMRSTAATATAAAMAAV